MDPMILPTQTAIAAAIKACSALLACVIAVTPGTYPRTTLNNVHPTVPVTLDLTGSAFTNLSLENVSNLTLKGGSFTGGAYSLVTVADSDHITLTGFGCFSPVSACLTLARDTYAEVSQWQVTGSRGDGIDIAGSSNVNVHDGSCQGNVVTATHPDCVQMWSLQGLPPQHIVVQHVNVHGATQGIDNNPSVYGETGQTDIQFLDNTISTTASNCVLLIGVTKAVVTGNHCTTLYGAQWPALVKVFCPTATAPYGPCLDAIVRDNVNGGPPPLTAPSNK